MSHALSAAGYGSARAAEAILATLPEDGGRAVGATLGRLAYRPLGIRREVVERQIAAAFPGSPRAWVRATARACYLHFGREAAATLRLARRGRSAVLEQVTNAASTAATLRDVAGEGGALVVTGHLGNWELAGAVLGSAGMPVTAVARPQHGRFDRRLAQLRAELGMETVTMDEAPHGIPRALERGHLVALVADQHAGSRGVVVSFFGRPASTFRGPARLAQTLGVPLLFGALVRSASTYEALVEPVPAPAEGSRRERELELTRRWVDRLEHHVRGRPEQYFWFHRRWKTAERRERNGGAGGEVGRAEVESGASPRALGGGVEA